MKSYCKGYRIGVAEVRSAYDDWRTHDSGRKNRWRVGAEYGGEEAMISEIASEVRDRSLALPPMRSYRATERGKVRRITVESVKQQVCDYAAVHALQPMLDSRLGFWQYGSAHVRRSRDLASIVQTWQRDARWWVHLDVRKCYQSISTDTARALLRKYVRSADVLYLLDVILAQHGDALALGSYLSLRLAQWVLSFGYHFVESLHKQRRGSAVPLVTHQCWYADDAWLFGTRKRDVQRAARELERYLGGFGLTLHDWHVRPMSEPVDVAGWVVRPDRITLRGSSFLRASRALRRYRREPTEAHARTLVAHNGQFLQSDSRRFAEAHDLTGAVASARRSISHGGKG